MASMISCSVGRGCDTRERNPLIAHLSPSSYPDALNVDVPLVTILHIFLVDCEHTSSGQSTERSMYTSRTLLATGPRNISSSMYVRNRRECKASVSHRVFDVCKIRQKARNLKDRHLHLLIDTSRTCGLNAVHLYSLAVRLCLNSVESSHVS